MSSFEKSLMAIALMLVAVPARAQTPDARWQPLVGCWELSGDDVRDAAPAYGQLENAPRIRAPREGAPRVCVTPADGGARFETTVRGQSTLDHTVIADGAPHPLSDSECTGTQSAEWSKDGLRLFSRADLTCKDDTAPRHVWGLSLLAPNGTWLDIQAVSIGSRESVRVRRYYRASGTEPLSRATRATITASSLTLEDVKEAAQKVSAGALEAALVETNAGFNLKGNQLVDLDNAGVPDRVIDLIVALSYPDRFVIERTARRSAGAFSTDPFLLGWSFGYPVWYDDFSYSPYYYTPFGYYGGSLQWYGTPLVTMVEIGPDRPQPSGAARAVNGQGYTRIRPRESEPTDGGTRTTRNTGFPADTSSSTSSSSGSSGSSSSSSGGSTASSGGGYSAGSSGGDTGRTAVPR